MAPLPASLATVPEADLQQLPHYGSQGCRAIGMTPEDQRQNLRGPVPAGFNTLPATLPMYNGQ